LEFNRDVELMKQKGVCKMKTLLSQKARTDLRERHKNLFSELDVFLNGYLICLKRVSVPVENAKHNDSSAWRGKC